MNKNVLWIILGAIIVLFVGYSFLGFGKVNQKVNCDSNAINAGAANNCVAKCDSSVTACYPGDKSYCSKKSNVCMSYNECVVNGEPSSDGPGSVCFSGV